jgi:hypothetical protein
MADPLPDAFLVSAAASALLQELEWDAADLFARHLSGNWGELLEEVVVMNEDPESGRRLSCYWHDRDAGLGLVVVEEDDQLALVTTAELAAASGVQSPSPPSALH